MAEILCSCSKGSSHVVPIEEPRNLLKNFGLVRLAGFEPAAFCSEASAPRSGAWGGNGLLGEVSSDLFSARGPGRPEGSARRRRQVIIVHVIAARLGGRKVRRLPGDRQGEISSSAKIEAVTPKNTFLPMGFSKFRRASHPTKQGARHTPAPSPAPLLRPLSGSGRKSSIDAEMAISDSYARRDACLWLILVKPLFVLHFVGLARPSHLHLDAAHPQAGRIRADDGVTRAVISPERDASLSSDSIPG